MTYLYSFLFVGFISMIGQIILDNSKLTTGHITSIFVIVGCMLESFDIYDKIIKIVGSGASVPIISFGHSLTHSVIKRINKDGIIGLFTGMFDMTASGITAAIIFTCIFSIIFKPKN